MFYPPINPEIALDRSLQGTNALIALVTFTIVILPVVFVTCAACYRKLRGRRLHVEEEPINESRVRINESRVRINETRADIAQLAATNIIDELTRLVEDRKVELHTPKSNASSFEVLNESYDYRQESFDNSEGNRLNFEGTLRTTNDNPSLPVSPPIATQRETAPRLFGNTPESNASSFEVLNESYDYRQESLDNSEVNRLNFEGTLGTPNDNPSLPVSPPIATPRETAPGNIPESNAFSFDILNESFGYGQGSIGNSEGKRSDLEKTYRAPRDSPSLPASPPFARLRVLGKKEEEGQDTSCSQIPGTHVLLGQAKRQLGRVGSHSPSSRTSSSGSSTLFHISMSDDSDREQRRKDKDYAKRLRNERRLRREKLEQEAAVISSQFNRKLQEELKRREAQGVAIPYKRDVVHARRKGEGEGHVDDAQVLPGFRDESRMMQLCQADLGYVPDAVVAPSYQARLGGEVEFDCERQAVPGDGEPTNGQVVGDACQPQSGQYGAGPRKSEDKPKDNVTDDAFQTLPKQPYGAVPKRLEAKPKDDVSDEAPQTLPKQPHGAAPKRSEAKPKDDVSDESPQTLPKQPYGAAPKRSEAKPKDNVTDDASQILPKQPYGATPKRSEAKPKDDVSDEAPQTLPHHHYGAVPKRREAKPKDDVSDEAPQTLPHHHYGAVPKRREAKPKDDVSDDAPQTLPQHHYGAVPKRREAKPKDDVSDDAPQTLPHHHYGAVPKRPKVTSKGKVADGVLQQSPRFGAGLKTPKFSVAGGRQKLFPQRHGAVPKRNEGTAKGKVGGGVSQQTSRYGTGLRGSEATAKKGFTDLEWYDDMVKRPEDGAAVTGEGASGDVSQPISRPESTGFPPLPALGPMMTERRKKKKVPSPATVAPRTRYPDLSDPDTLRRARDVFNIEMDRREDEIEQMGAQAQGEIRVGDMHRAVETLIMSERLQEAEARQRAEIRRHYEVVVVNVPSSESEEERAREGENRERAEVPHAVVNMPSSGSDEEVIDLNERHYI